jgi:hypothetical protein
MRPRGDIERIRLAADRVDVIICKCVIELSVDEPCGFCAGEYR